jgi:hypothetical protein
MESLQREEGMRMFSSFVFALGVSVWPITAQTTIAPSDTLSAKEEPSTSAASPPLNDNEPFGIAVRGGVPPYRLSWQKGGRTEPGSLRIKWGMQHSEVERLMGPLPKSDYGSARPPMACLPENAGAAESCYADPEAPWYVDFGDAQVGAATPFLKFTKDGRFFGYFATFPVVSFETIKAILVKRLEHPTTDNKGTVQNRMGATFEQETIVWILPHVRIELLQRGTDINTGLLSGTYIPIEATLPKAPEGKAPM